MTNDQKRKIRVSALINAHTTMIDSEFTSSWEPEVPWEEVSEYCEAIVDRMAQALGFDSYGDALQHAQWSRLGIDA